VTEGPANSAPAAEVRTSSRSETRGFLFADIRGYTQYVERQGASAAADMLLRYRAVVRDAITRNDGAEIRTEGDSFYVVLRSASDAVLCGQAIVKGVAEENKRTPDAPIRVGVGVHAGEAIDTAEGLVGSAVNVAARACALARPGEVLVTDTVRGLARSVIQVNFVSRGNQRLKGVAEPIELFSVTDATVAPRGAVGGRPPWLALAGAVGGLALIAAVGYAALVLTSNQPVAAVPSGTGLGSFGASLSPALSGASQASPTGVPSSIAPTLLKWQPQGAAPGHLQGGDYELGAFRPTVGFTLDNTKGQGADWWFTCGRTDFATISAWDTGKIFPGVGEFDLPDNANPCYWQGVGKPEVDILSVQTAGTAQGCTEVPSATIQTPQDLYEWLSSISVLTTSVPEPVIVAGRAALRVQTELNGDVGLYCHSDLGAEPGAPLEILKTASEHITINHGDKAEFLLLDIGTSAPLVIHAEAPADVWTTALTRLQPVLDSMTIGE